MSFRIGQRPYVIADIGINHNGDLDTALKMIRTASQCGVDAVKFQKRTVNLVYTEEELAAPRESPFGKTNGDLKRGLEFDAAAYAKIDECCKEEGIEWFASPWDVDSVEFLMQFDIPYMKIASALITDADVLKACAETEKELILSTGMADVPMIKEALMWLKENKGKVQALMHCTSTYPTAPEHVNLLGMKQIEGLYWRSYKRTIPVGFSGHYPEIWPYVFAMSMGAVAVEFHMTLDRKMWGSDQKASLEPKQVKQICIARDQWEAIRGDGKVRFYDDEKPVAEKLRKRNTVHDRITD